MSAIMALKQLSYERSYKKSNGKSADDTARVC